MAQTKRTPRRDQGERSTRWRGDQATPHSARMRSYVVLPVLGTCAECEVIEATDRHHWDGDVYNNVLTNLYPVCSPCHHRIHRVLKTHCLHGHPLSGDNLYVAHSGQRVCRECQRVWGRAFTARKAAEAASSRGNPPAPR